MQPQRYCSWSSSSSNSSRDSSLDCSPSVSSAGQKRRYTNDNKASSTVRSGPTLTSNVLRLQNEAKSYHVLSRQNHQPPLVNINMMPDEPEDDSSDSSQELHHAKNSLHPLSRTSKSRSRKPETQFREETADRELSLLQLDDDFNGFPDQTPKSKERISAFAQKEQQKMGETCSDFCKIANFTLQREDFPEKGLIIEKFQCKNNHSLTHLCERQINISIEGANPYDDPFSKLTSNLPSKYNPANKGGVPQRSITPASPTSSLSSSSSTSSLSASSSASKTKSKKTNYSKQSNCDNKKSTKQQQLQGINSTNRNYQKQRSVTSQSKNSASQSQRTRNLPAVPDLGLFHV